MTIDRRAPATALTLLGLMLLLRLWIPVSFSDASPYARMNLLTAVEPRALMGTMLHALSGHAEMRHRLLLGINLVSVMAWLGCVLALVGGRSLGGNAGRPLSMAERLAWAALFAFSANPYHAYISMFVDMPAAALVAATALACTALPHRVTATRVLGVTLLALASTLVHEKSLFDLALLALWFSYWRGPAAAAALLGPAFLLTGGFLLASSENASWGLPTRDYAAYAVNPIFTESVNVWGILVGGGAFWLVYGVLGGWFCRAAMSRTDRLWRTLLVAAMLLVCLGTLLVAHDTNRMVALIWLPTALLAGAVIHRPYHRPFGARAFAALIVLQLAAPPSLIFKHGMLPYNCYAARLGQRLPQESVVGQVGGLSLMSYDRNYLTQVMNARCR